jgi:hypothetical protein
MKYVAGQAEGDGKKEAKAEELETCRHLFF